LVHLLLLHGRALRNVLTLYSSRIVLVCWRPRFVELHCGFPLGCCRGYLMLCRYTCAIPLSVWVDGICTPWRSCLDTVVSSFRAFRYVRIIVMWIQAIISMLVWTALLCAFLVTLWSMQLVCSVLNTATVMDSILLSWTLNTAQVLSLRRY
jgi:hypothetical protein